MISTSPSVNPKISLCEPPTILGLTKRENFYVLCHIFGEKKYYIAQLVELFAL